MTLQRIDCQALGGVAGDMFAAAMFDAFPALYNDFLNDLSRLSVAGLQATLSAQTSNGLYAQNFQVSQTTDIKPPRTLPAVEDFLGNTALDVAVVSTATAIYRLLAEAEA
ncbi:MAG: nickel insertion protein, partial [Pseudomonadota bacterium]